MDGLLVQKTTALTGYGLFIVATGSLAQVCMRGSRLRVLATKVMKDYSRTSAIAR